ncbi:MAG: site-2 protease family protein [Chloroflexi bacterium]|nr:site-2 protease family protein [Chloroflexota bacterium]
MLYPLFDLLARDPGAFLLTLPVVVFVMGGAILSAITVHEFGHALVARSLGDATAQRLGRVTLNPLAHLDPLGTLMLLVVGLGWGKPVPVNPFLLRHGRAGMALVSGTGPLANFLTAALLAIPVKLGVIPLSLSLAAALRDPGDIAGLLLTLYSYAILYNMLLGLFNLIPLPPLDGSKVLLGIAPSELALRLSKWEAYGPIIFVGIIAADALLNTRILGSILGPAVRWLSQVLTGASFA